MKYSVWWNDKQALWKHIDTFFNIDSQQKFRLTRKLTMTHIHPHRLSRMKVKYAAQVFNSSVAAGISVHCQHKSLPTEAMATAELLSKFNNLFDAVNSSNLKSAKQWQRAMSEQSGHIQFFLSNIDWLSKIEFFYVVGNKLVTNNIKCVQGWIKSLNAIVQLFSHLRETHDLKFLMTRRLNQDCLEKFFGVIRTKGGCCDNPTALQFSHHFKRACCTSLLMQISTGNVASDNDKMLLNLRSCLSIKNIHRQPCLTQTCSSLNKVSVSDFTIRSLPEQNAFVYVCGYLLKKLLSVYSCEICLTLKKTGSSSGTSNYIMLKNYHDFALSQPSILFTMYISQCETVFNNYFSKNRHLAGIGQKILKIL